MNDEADTSATARRHPCPECRTGRSGDDRFCEACGHDFDAAPRTTGWKLVVAADRGWFERHVEAGLAFPADFVEQSFSLEAAAVRIGRSDGRPGEPVVEIDLSGPREDPAVSRVHAVLERQPDGSYAIRDAGSTNGTTVNDDPVATHVPMAIAQGDRIHVGAWTMLTVRRV
jgi:hypothetical protein